MDKSKTLLEQIEEEAVVLKIITRLKAFDDDKSVLYLMDKELSDRKYKPHEF